MANTRKKRGRSKGGEVAAPTNEVTTSVEAGGVPLMDTQPPKKKRGRRSKRKVGSENEPVETAPEDGELNISEEGVTEATATTILQDVTNSTEVGGVPPTDPLMSEVPNSDEGVVLGCKLLQYYWYYCIVIFFTVSSMVSNENKAR